MIALFKEAWRLSREHRVQECDRLERAAVARTFNDRYTYRHRLDYSTELGWHAHAWMCPECNDIHQPTEFDGMVGLKYPACCTTAAGHRLYARIRTS